MADADSNANADAKIGKSSDGREMHYSVGALIKRNGKYLLIDRVNVPLGFAGLAGHVDEGETIERALVREVEEESGLKMQDCRLLFEEEVGWNDCSKGIGVHYWYLYECETSGEPVLNKKEARSIGWYSANEIRKFDTEKKLEPVWRYWFGKLGMV